MSAIKEVSGGVPAKGPIYRSRLSQLRYIKADNDRIFRALEDIVCDLSKRLERLETEMKKLK